MAVSTIPAKKCEKCGAAPAVVNLATAANAAPDAPDYWLCMECFRQGANWELTEAGIDIAEHLKKGGRLS
jgi:hypothetical protein